MAEKKVKMTAREKAKQMEEKARRLIEASKKVLKKDEETWGSVDRRIGAYVRDMAAIDFSGVTEKQLKDYITERIGSQEEEKKFDKIDMKIGKQLRESAENDFAGFDYESVKAWIKKALENGK